MCSGLFPEIQNVKNLAALQNGVLEIHHRCQSLFLELSSWCMLCPLAGVDVALVCL